MTYEYNEVILGDPNEIKLAEHKHVYDVHFYIEFLILAVCPIPFYDMYVPIYCNQHTKVVYFLNELMFAFMFLRIIVFVKSFLNYSIYSDPYSRKLAKFYGCESCCWFTFKCYVYTKPKQTIMFMFKFTILFGAYLLRIFEMPYYRMMQPDEWAQFDHYWMSIWVVTISVVTTGYGDLYASTRPGQYLTLFLAIWAAFLVSMVYGMMKDVFTPCKKQ